MQSDPIKSPGPKALGSFLRLSWGFEILLAALGFLSLVLIYFWEILVPEIVFRVSDHISFFIPQRMRWVQQALDGSFPLWNPDLMGGLPLFATLQTAVLYPFSIFYLWFPFFQVFKLTLFAHYALAGFGMYVLMRGDGTSRMGSMLAALCFMLGGYLISLHYYLSTLFPVAWIPILLLFFFWGIRHQDYRGAVLAGSVTAFMFFSGGAETCMQVLPWLAIAGLFPEYIFQDEKIRDRTFQIKYLLACFFIFAGLSAIQLLPTYELSQLSGRGAGFDFEKATQWSLALSDLTQLITADPYAYYQAVDNKVSAQVWLRSLYIGSLPLILSWFFIRSGRRRVFFIGMITIFSILMAMGKNSILYQAMFEWIPWVQSIRYPVKFILPVMILLPMAAGWGWDIFRAQINQQEVSAYRRALSLLVLSALCMLLFASLNWQPETWLNSFSDRSQNNALESVHNYRRLALFTALISFCLFLAYKAVKTRTVFLSLALFLYGVDVFYGGITLFNVIPVETFNTLSEEARVIQSDPEKGKVFISSDTESAPENQVWKKTIRGVTGASRHMPLDIRTLPNIQQVNSWTVFHPSRSREFYNLMNQEPLIDRINLMAMLNVKHVLTSQSLVNENFKKVYSPERKISELDKTQPPPVSIYKIPHQLGQAFLVGSCYEARSDSEIKQALLSPQFHPQTLVVLETSPPELPCKNPASPKAIESGSVTLIKESYDSLTLDVDTREKSFLFMGDNYYPGWEAFVNGKPAAIYRANFSFRALVLKPGHHRVKMVYRPLSFRVGGWISALTLILCAVVLIKHPQREKALPIVSKTKPVPSQGHEKTLPRAEWITETHLAWSLYLFIIFLTTFGASDIYFSQETGERFLLPAFFSLMFLQVMLVLTKWNDAKVKGFSALTACWMVFLLWSAFGFFYSIRPEDGLYYIFNYLGALSLLLGLALYLTSRKKIVDLLRILLVCAGGHALLSMYGQVMFPRDITGWKSLFINANFLASYLLFPIAISFYFYIFGESKRDRNLGGWIFFLTGICLGFTQSRSGLLAGILEIFLVFGFLAYQKNRQAFKKGFYLLAGSGVIYLLILSTLYFIWNQSGVLEAGDSLSLVAHGTDVSRSASARMVFWQASLNIFNDFPLIGSGPRSYPLLFPYYGASIDQASYPIHAHSTYLNILTDHGAIGLLLFLAGILFIFRKLRHIFRFGGDCALGFFLAAGMSGFLIHGLVEFCLPNPVFFYSLIFAIAMIDRLTVTRTEKMDTSFFQSRGMFLASSILVSMVAMSGMGSLYFYSRIMNHNIPKATEIQNSFDQSTLALKFCPQCDRPYLYRAWAYMLDYDQNKNPESLVRANIELERARRRAYINPEQGMLKARWWMMQKRYDMARQEYWKVYRFSRRYKEARDELVILNRMMKQKPVL